MPLYDYECLSCGQDFESVMTIADREKALCQCGGKGKQILKRSTRASGFSVFEAGYWRDIGPNGTYINNPQELRDALDRTGSRAGYLEDGCWGGTSPGPDPIGIRGADPDTRNDRTEY